MPAPDSQPRSDGAHPVDSLAAEHGIIAAVLDAIEREVKTNSANSALRTGFWKRVLEFVHDFVELCHHGKEERALLPALLESGRSERVGPVVVMKSEHVDGREFEQRLAAAAGGAGNLQRAARDYIALMRQHMAAEESGVFRLARESLAPEQLAGLHARFAQIDDEILGPDGYRRYVHLATEVCAEHGIQFSMPKISGS